MAKKPVFKSSPEAAIQGRIIDFLRKRGWFVKETHGNAFQTGFPDLYLYHKDYGHKWVDVKNPSRYVYTKAQCQQWPGMDAAGVGIWIMFEANEENYANLFKAPNWREFWKPAYDKYIQPLDEILLQLEEPE